MLQQTTERNWPSSDLGCMRLGKAKAKRTAFSPHAPCHSAAGERLLRVMRPEMFQRWPSGRAWRSEAFCERPTEEQTCGLRERADRLMAELLRATADTLAVKEAVVRLEGELAGLRARPWWRRLAG